MLTLPPHPFDYVYLSDALKQYRYPRNKIQRLIEHNDIIRIKKGLYVPGQLQDVYIHKKTLANLIYGPSYISLDSALSYWGLIPERVEEITSVTSKRNKLFTTPLGVFSYRYLSTSKFNTAVDLIVVEQASFLMATKEKAICDKLYFSQTLFTQVELIEYLEQDLRVDFDEILSLRRTVLRELKKRFNHANVSLFIDWYLEHGNKER
jgi:predicted transcriptional regulator of viral defense system